MAGSKVIALIRGINVGKANRLPMVELRSLLARLGFQSVLSLLNSGNLVFKTEIIDMKRIANMIEEALRREFNMTARVSILSGETLNAILKWSPYGSEGFDPSKILFAIPFHDTDLTKLHILASKDWEPERLSIGAHAACLWCPGGIHKSKLARGVDQFLGKSVTCRNASTLLKLKIKMDNE